MHFEIQVDPANAIGRQDPAGVKDILLEAALTTIIDCEESVAAVDADDRILYDQDTGSLYYDSNGSGSGGRVLFAHIDNGFIMTAGDFVVI